MNLTPTVMQMSIQTPMTPSVALSKTNRPMRTRARISSLDKQKICLYRKSHPSIKQSELAAVFHVGRSTISKLLKHQDIWAHPKKYASDDYCKRRFGTSSFVLGMSHESI